MSAVSDLNIVQEVLDNGPLAYRGVEVQHVWLEGKEWAFQIVGYGDAFFLEERGRRELTEKARNSLG